MGTLIWIGFLLLAAGMGFALMLIPMPLSLGKSKEKWYPKVIEVIKGTGVALSIIGVGIILYAVATIFLH